MQVAGHKFSKWRDFFELRVYSLDGAGRFEMGWMLLCAAVIPQSQINTRKSHSTATETRFLGEILV
ncbi:MAG: hypothetical protein EAZ60_17335 [Oscillatoriales cyanobacterium]|nr:MAG: hypothetical protein EAZ83_10175 [Oscillatoriales cyanobacterium]TAF01022.1 MAG: hypothetical protein EAZ79_01060 [Oscillatoriales cyanobacterium]TAF19550.1 MAG: hypothetical protein EAZ73_14720 [Oscillatoriales cyanobacterium]TAF38403.1 MAG: hypothetical protein EAZ69_04480 [Oscillatoriales cyanobacterium]TAF54303.1 MAG: hypothetical protein EAZ60_17335 [Oscillatoriales cyanobacterium]